ncbi:MAG: DUF6064 family protein [Pseudoxanthomonas sp.]
MAQGLDRLDGWTLVAYASIGYPLLGQMFGHGYPAMPMFGITPCPVTIFTFGLFLLTTEPVPRRLLVIPVVWSVIGGSAAFLLSIPQDWPLLVSGVTVLVLLKRDREIGGMQVHGAPLLSFSLRSRRMPRG